MSSNLERFLTGVARRSSDWTPKIQRKTFEHRGRIYVAIRFCGGRVELYRIECDDYTETWMRYAIPGNGPLDDAAIWAVADRLDPAALMARDLLAGRYPTARNVRMGPTYGEWGSVIADYVHPETGKARPLYASIRVYQPIGGAS